MDDVFFQYIDENDIKTVVHLGDVTDRRKFINFYTATRLHDDFIQPILDRNIELLVTIGNHDTYFKNTNNINSMKRLYGDNDHIRIFDEPIEVDLDGLKTLMIPWICDDTYEKTMKMIKSSTCPVLMGHLEIKGFEMYRGHTAEHGMSMDTFKKFDLVCSGHYHHKSNYGNIHYLGSHTQFTWGDYGDERGFHVLDTKTRELEFIKNPYTMFHKIHYNGTGNADVLYNDYNGSYVKIVVENRDDEMKLDRLVNMIEMSAQNVQLIENNDGVSVYEVDEIVNEVQDTLTILEKYVDIADTPPSINKENTKKFLHALYNEALEVTV